MRMNERQASAIQDVFRKLAFVDTEPVDLPNSGIDWQETVEIIYRLFTLRWMEFWPQKEITDEDIWEYCRNLARYDPDADLYLKSQEFDRWWGYYWLTHINLTSEGEVFYFKYFDPEVVNSAEDDNAVNPAFIDHLESIFEENDMPWGKIFFPVQSIE
ncbi:TPA: hypothetical protein ACFRHB_002063 [Neisseria lactamica]